MSQTRQTFADTHAAQPSRQIQSTENRGMGLARLARTAGMWAVLVAGTAAADSGLDVSTVTTGTAHRDLYAVAIGDNGHGIAVGDRGSLVVTSDGGQTWERRDYDTRRAFLDIAMAGERQVAVGQDGMIIWRDGDGEWTEVEPITEERLLGVSLNRDGFGVAVGTFGTMIMTEDGGESWSDVDFDITEVTDGGYQAHINDVAVTEDGTTLAVGEFGLVLRSTADARDWQVVRRGESSLFSIKMRGDGTGYAVGQEGTVSRSTDGGQTWTDLETGIDGNLLGVHADDNGHILAPGMRHMIYSDDDGETWQLVTAGDVDENWYMGAVAADDGSVLAVGHTGRIIRIGEARTN